MNRHPRFRVLAGLTVLLGVAHLLSTDAAAAAEGGTASAMDCASWAEGYAAGYCDAKGHDGVESVSYTCNPDGTAKILRVVCYDG